MHVFRWARGLPKTHTVGSVRLRSVSLNLKMLSLVRGQHINSGF